MLRLAILWRWIYQRRGFLMRALLCWAFSLFFLKFDENGNYDIRFKLRPEQKASQDIVLVTLRASEFTKMYDLKTSTLIHSTELADLNDGFYWDKDIWLSLLNRILKQEPQKVGVAMYFGENVGHFQLSQDDIKIFKDPRVIWAANSSESGKLALPFAARGDKSNIGHMDTVKDDDGIVRRVMTTSDVLSSFSEKLQKKGQAKKIENLSIINYKGRKIFQEISLSDALSPSLPSNFFKNKIVIIGTEKSSSAQIQTPLGLLSRHEFWAQVTENLQTQSFIRKLPGVVYAFFLLGLSVIAILTITHYPQAIALFLLVWVATFTSAFSAWVFDSFYFWIPIVSPLSLLIFVWVLFIGYQALKIEQAHTRLQQQQNYLAELEQLKNNFVSLISHDLKTPIAKIQGVLDRLMTQQDMKPEIQSDLQSLKEYSEELNRYIQSILKVLRVESRDFKILKETADINGVIENVLERLGPLALSKNINLQASLEPMFLIEIDVTLMTEVFLNIIENAIKYTPGNGQVLVRSFETEKDICVEISDSGEGISPEDQEIIWNKFTRGKSQDYKTKGSGLGLYLVKYFIELHGGEISMQSQVGKGTTFLVRLPIEEASVEAEL
ncbi:MAG: sensory transduction histidine kinase [Pseudobdellovibrio sp.]|jgi:signal transduction histidine kinase|nr:sensory transduction histidine kinase [Pseudobdellovibrio sp.]